VASCKDYNAATAPFAAFVDVASKQLSKGLKAADFTRLELLTTAVAGAC
jgi:hypothetical protein